MLFYYRWLDSGEDDCLIERELEPLPPAEEDGEIQISKSMFAFIHTANMFLI